MSDSELSNVYTAFEMLLEEVEAEIDFVNDVGARGFEARNYEQAKDALERAGQLTSFRDKIAALRKEWASLAAVADEAEDEVTQAERRNLGRVRRGQRTPEADYYLPILQTLDAMGGSGKVSTVLDAVGKIMQPVLKEIDHDPLASDPRNTRWHNTAQWARHSLVQEGLLKSDSRRGIWEISEEGRAWLKRHGGRDNG